LVHKAQICCYLETISAWRYKKQINVVDSEILKKAQIEPDKYKNLVVRVSGYSAYFVNLDKELQNEIIMRTEKNKKSV
jgi:pyruvate-formate lyase